MNLSCQQLVLLRHMLGINTPNSDEPEPYRDYYCAAPNDPQLVALERAGAVDRYAVRDGYWWYKTTPEGRSAALSSHKSIRKSRVQRRYARYLEIRDVYGELTFREFLTNPEFADARRVA